MLERIKSIYFVKELFEKITDKDKLKLVKYNKTLQNIININLRNYKIFSGRYIIYGEKRKGKEYDSFYNYILYEGEFLNGERNGKGKEYDYNGELI